mgnify:FL=1
MRWSLPNILTVFRLAAAPALAVVYLLLPHPLADWAALALFLGAAATDWLDGRIARAWGQVSRMGAMLDPIADKAMVAVALLVLVAFSSHSGWILLPAALILFREVFVSGLREYLGAAAGTLKVTRLAKWKTTLQMVAVAVLFAHGIFEHHFGMIAMGMDRPLVEDILSGREEDLHGLRLLLAGALWTGQGGVALLWLSAALTLWTGWEYFRKAVPYLKD